MNNFRTRVRQFTADQSKEHLRRLVQLREMGIDVGSDRDFLRAPIEREKLRLEHLDTGLNCCHDMPGEGFIFVAQVRLTIFSSIFFIAGCEMTASWDHFPLELERPEDFLFYRDIIAECHSRPPMIVNPWLTGERLLRYGRKEGLIIAKGHQSIPARCLEHSQVSIELFLSDERGDEFPFTFRAQVSRALKVTYERRQREMCRGKTRTPLFPERQYGPKEQSAPAEPFVSPLGDREGDDND